MSVSTSQPVIAVLDSLFKETFPGKMAAVYSAKCLVLSGNMMSKQPHVYLTPYNVSGFVYSALK